MQATKIHTAIATKTAAQEQDIKLVSASGRSFRLTSAQASKLSTVSQQLETQGTKTLHLSKCGGELNTISDHSLDLVVKSCALAETHGTMNACAHGGHIAQLLVVQETKKVLDFAAAVRLLGCQFAFGVSADVFKTRLAGCKNVKEINLALGFAFDFNADGFHRAVKQTKWYLRMKVDGACQWIYDLWASIKFAVATSVQTVKSAWHEFIAAIAHTAVEIQTTITAAHHKLFCEIIPTLHAEVIARLSMSCQWLREICLPTMFSVLVVRPGLWIQSKVDDFKMQIDKFFQWFELHKFVLKIEVSAKINAGLSIQGKHKAQIQHTECQQQVVAAADHTFLRIQENREQFSALYKCIFSSTELAAHWSETVAKLDVKCVQLKNAEASATSSSSSTAVATQLKAKVDTVIVDARDLMKSDASSLFLYQDVAVLRVGIKFTRDARVASQSGILLVTSPAAKTCPPELLQFRAALSQKIESTQMLAKTSVSEVRYEFIEKETNRTVLVTSDGIARGF